MVNVLFQATTDPNLEHWYVPMPGPPQPPPPKQTATSMSKDRVQDMAEAKAKNAAKIAGVTNYGVEALIHAEGPRAV
eukprot:1092867-Amphidinium_carterae.1